MSFVDPESFGWSHPKRKAYFKDSEQSAKAHYQVEFMGRIDYLPIIRVPIQLPKYRLSNGRTASAQEEYLATNPDKPEDFFTRDPESYEAQKVQHDILWKMVNGANLLTYFKDGAVQKEPIILDNNGFVVNGNRRLCAWRELYYKRTDEYKFFQHIDVIVLPPGDDAAIDELEGTLQVQPDIREDYNWDSLANMMRQKQKSRGLTDKDLTKLYRMKESEVREMLDMLDYAEAYLISRNIPKRWSAVSGNELAFREMVKCRQSLKSATPGEKQLFEEIAFNLIDNPEGGRLYAAIPLAKKYLTEIQEELLNDFPVETPKEQPSPFFGQVQVSPALPLAGAISRPENRDKSRETIREVIEVQKEIEKDKTSADYLLKKLKTSNAAIQAAITGGLKPESNKVGVAEQLQSIIIGVGRIREWLEKNAQN